MGRLWQIPSRIARHVRQNHEKPSGGVSVTRFEDKVSGQLPTTGSSNPKGSGDMPTRLPPMMSSRKLMSPAGAVQKIPQALERKALAWAQYTDSQYVFISVYGEGDEKTFTIHGSDQSTIAQHRAQTLCSWKALASSWAEVVKNVPRIPMEQSAPGKLLAGNISQPIADDQPSDRIIDFHPITKDETQQTDLKVRILNASAEANRYMTELHELLSQLFGAEDAFDSTDEEGWTEDEPE